MCGIMERDKLKKAIIFDCDNTIWSGIAGEGDVTPDLDILDDIIFLADHGVIVGICSKNNESDISQLLIDYGIMQVISVKRINWKDKVSNLKEIAEELNIGLDAMVLVDDSTFERELVYKYLPEVLTIHPNNLMITVAKWFDLSGEFTKTQQYKDNLKRARVQEQFTNIDDFLASLNMVLTIKYNDITQIDRISELTNKTNQFNLTTKRYTPDEIKNLMTYCLVYSLSVKDDIGDHGITGVCILESGKIDTFLLSCRILGKGIEYAFMDYLVNNVAVLGFKHLIGEYISTEKNIQVKYFFTKCGFETLLVTRKSTIFMLPFDKYKTISKPHFTYGRQYSWDNGKSI
jgi:FkbH-like protein